MSWEIEEIRDNGDKRPTFVRPPRRADYGGQVRDKRYKDFINKNNPG